MNKFFNNVSYKNKVLYFSSLLLTTSIVCPLTSCGSDGTSNDIGGFDKEFGFDAQTYNRLERQFTSKYGAYLKDKTSDENEYINKFNNFLQNDLTILRNKLFDPAQNYSFTIRTNALLDYASKNYNINLNRNANVGEIDFENLKQSSLENFIIYMENAGFTKAEIDERKAEFNKKFVEILNDLRPTTDDNAQILMQLRANIIDCWQDLNDEFAYMSAYNHLRNFFDEYKIIVKDQSDNLENDNKLLWDNLVRNPTFMGGSLENIGKIDQDINCPIEDDWINKLFTISKQSNKSEKEEVEDSPAGSNQNNDASSDKPNGGFKEIIPGYILTPVLKTMSQDIYSNNYYMNIDWQLMCSSYKNKVQEIKDKVTAHLAYNKDGTVINYAGFKNNQLSSDSYQFTRYSLMASPDYQKEKLTEAYFDQTKEPDQKITFSWDKDKIGIEYYLLSDPKNDDFIAPDESYKVSMGQGNLSSIGLQLNGTNLFDLLSKKTNLQNSQFANNDDNLKIEEKFVKYCNIINNANVSFSDNKISNNAIENNFVAEFKNTNIQSDVRMKSTMNNIGPSKIFNNNAINFYKKVADYVNAGKILNEFEAYHWLSNVIKYELWIVAAIIGILWLWEIIKSFLLEVNGQPVYDNNDSILQWEVTCLAIYTAVWIALYSSWTLAVSDPISNEVDKLKKWNDIIENGSKSNPDKKINVIDKVNDDKDNFTSTDEFMKYYEKNSNNAFVSYFYYFHFVELSQNQTNDKQSITFNKKVKKDYDDFNNTKIDCEINDRICGRIIIGIILSLLLLCVLCALFLMYTNTKKLIKRRNNLMHPNPALPNPALPAIAIAPNLNHSADNIQILNHDINNGILVNNEGEGINVVGDNISL